MRILVTLAVIITAALAFTPFDPTCFHISSNAPVTRTEIFGAAPTEPHPVSPIIISRCTECVDELGVFAVHGKSYACFHGRVPTNWNPVESCDLVGMTYPDCTPLIPAPHLAPRPICWDLAGHGDADPDAKLVVLWGYKRATVSKHIKIEHGCHNYFEPATAVALPEDFAPAPLSPRASFVAVTARDRCQMWHLGNEERTVCANSGPPHNLRRCSSPHWEVKTPEPEPEPKPEPEATSSLQVSDIHPEEPRQPEIVPPPPEEPEKEPRKPEIVPPPPEEPEKEPEEPCEPEEEDVIVEICDLDEDFDEFDVEFDEFDEFDEIEENIEENIEDLTEDVPDLEPLVRSQNAVCSMIKSESRCILMPMCDWCVGVGECMVAGTCPSVQYEEGANACISISNPAECESTEGCHWCTGPAPVCYPDGLCPVIGE